MKTEIIIPGALRQYTNNRDSLESAGKTIEEVLSDLTTQYPQLKKHLFRDDGRLRNFVNIYINEDDIRSLEQEKTGLKEGDVISIISRLSISNGVGLEIDQYIILPS